MYDDDYWRQEQMRQDQLREQMRQEQIREQMQQEQIRQQMLQEQMRQEQIRQEQLREDRRREQIRQDRIREDRKREDILEDLRREDEQREQDEQRREEEKKQSEQMEQAMWNMIWENQPSSSKQPASAVNPPKKAANIVQPNTLKGTNRNNTVVQQEDSLGSILLKTAAGVAGAIALGWGLKWLADHEQTNDTTEPNKGD